MSKVFDTLRRQATPPAVPAVPSLAAAPSAAEEPAFIEIGPKRQVIAASPAVLASHPATANLPLSGPHHPRLRSVPASAPASPAPVLRRPRLAPELLAYHTPDNPVVARYAELLSAVREAASVKKATDKAILSLCPIRGEIGCTTVLLNLAIVSARQGRRTLVLDANTKAPAVAGRLGIVTAPGLMEILAGDATTGAIQGTDQDNLFALTAGHQGPLLADVQTLHDLLAQVRTQFDLVLIDGPRWDGKPATTALASASDAVFLVVPATEAEATPATDWLRTLPQQGIRLAGTILTAR
jgi:tyrosine-protein kinase Etk/Wzc